jgi:hypothetical protein
LQQLRGMSGFPIQNLKANIMKKQNLKSVMPVLVLVLMGCQLYAQGTEELKAKIIKINQKAAGHGQR